MHLLALLLALCAPIAEARYPVSDLLKPGKYSADLMTLGLDPSLNALFAKYTAALKTPGLMKELLAKTKPGQPLAYDSRLGITEAEYARIGEGLKSIKLVPTGKKQDLTIELAGDTFTLRSEACTPMKTGAKIDKTVALLSLAGYDPMKSSYFENHAADSPLAPFDGYSWRPVLAGKRVELTIGRRTQENFCIISCTYMVPGASEDILLRYDCVNAPSASAPAPAPSTAGADILADFDKAAKAEPAATPPPAIPVIPVRPAAPPPTPSEVRVPMKVTDKTPPVICRGALARYAVVTPSLVTNCKEANEHSAQVMNVYTYVYKGMGADLIHAIMRVKTQAQEDCAVQIAKQYGGFMPTKYFSDTCL